MLRMLTLISLFIASFNLYSGTDSKNDSEELIKGELFPVDYQKGIYHINKNFPASIIFKFTGLASPEKLKNSRMIIDLPEGYSCLGACPRFSNGTTSPNGIEQWNMEKMEIQDIEKKGLKYTRYIIMLSESVLKTKSFSWEVNERIYIRSNADFSSKNRKYAFFKLAADNWNGAERKFELILLPELEASSKKVNKFGLMISVLGSLTVPNPEIRDAYINYWTSISSRPCAGATVKWNTIGPDAKQIVIEKFNSLYFLPAKNGGTPNIGTYNIKKWFETKTTGNSAFRIPFMEVASDKAGKYQKTTENFILCPGYLSKNALFWDNCVIASMKEKLIDIPLLTGIIYDIEPGAMDYCFCENCRQEFKGYSKLEHLPSTEEIRKKYSSEWFNFRVMQNSMIIKRFCESVKKEFPGTQAIVCSDPLKTSGILAQWCGVDVRLSDNDADLFMNMPYYSGVMYYDDMELNNKTLKTPNFPLNDPAERMISFFSQYTPERIKQNIIATAALGCKGFGFWPDDALDGRYLQEIKNAYALAAKAEDYYFAKRNDAAVSVKPEIFFEKTIVDEGRNITLKFPDCSATLRWTVHEKDENYLVTIINYAPNELIVNLSAADIKKYTYMARDVETGGLFYKDKSTLLGSNDIKNGFLLNIMGNSLKVIEITKNDIKDTTDKTMAVYQDAIKQKLDDIRKNFPDDNNLKEAKSATSEISWGVLIDQNLPLIKMRFGDYKIYINIAKGAEIISWNDRKNLKDILLFKDRGFLDNLILSDDHQGMGEYRFVLEKTSIDNGNPVAAFKYTVLRDESANPEDGPLENLEIEKQITLKDNGKTINIKYVFTNKSKSKKDMLLGFRIKNFPRTAIRPENGESFSKMSKISFETSEGIKTIETGNSDTGNLILQDAAKTPGFLNVKPKPLKWINSPIRVDIQSGKRNEHLEFSPDKNNSSGFYVWWSDNAYTVELLSTGKLIKYDKQIYYEYSVSR